MKNLSVEQLERKLKVTEENLLNHPLKHVQSIIDGHVSMIDTIKNELKKRKNMDELTIEFSRQQEWFSVYRWDIYPTGSVLSGQDRKAFLDSFQTEAEAVEAYPTAKVGYRDAHNSFDHLPDEPDDGFFQREDGVGDV